MKSLIAVAVLMLSACGVDSDSPTVTGTVVAPPQAPSIDRLPTNAVLTVTLEDVSRADAPTTILSMQEIDLADVSFPVAFELPYDLGDIADRNTYRVAARVASAGDLLMISDTVIPVITNGAPTSGVEVPMIYIANN
ncbi:MAG TPA: YbaY family lipoprotein [Ilumatobacteraceae bacterium]|nr:YbaY family lipoprotein [Ilumatobacteraceae bacterium]